MEKTAAADRYAMNALLRQSLAENSYSDLTDKDADSIRKSIA
jgi:plasmid stabilization system protein ParE